MRLKPVLTIFVSLVILFASANIWAAQSAAGVPAGGNNMKKTATKAVTTSTVKPQKKPAYAPRFSIGFDVTRTTSLIDFQDGTRFDGIDYTLKPAMTLPYGMLLTYITYSQNLRDEYTKTENDFGDIPVIYSFPSTPIDEEGEYRSKITYSVTAVIPVSQYSTKRDQLQTSISGSIGFAVTPAVEGFSYNVGLSAGRNFHQYEENINNQVLNQYSSNQTLGAGYSVSDWSLGVTFINRTRWTYQNNVRSSFEISEEIGYSINDYFSAAIGHSNSGATLKPNGTDSNFDFVNEDTSVVYGTLSVTY